MSRHKKFQPRNDRPLNRFFLDDMAAHTSCACCGKPSAADNPMGFAGKCHPLAGTRVYY